VRTMGVPMRAFGARASDDDATTTRRDDDAMTR